MDDARLLNTNIATSALAHSDMLHFQQQTRSGANQSESRTTSLPWRRG
jgi:hypothetical protein